MNFRTVFFVVYLLVYRPRIWIVSNFYKKIFKCKYNKKCMYNKSSNAKFPFWTPMRTVFTVSCNDLYKNINLKYLKYSLSQLLAITDPGN